MRVCFVIEGCYPYVVGGVSSWIDGMIKAFPDIEYVLLCVVASRKMRGKFVYDLPCNVSEVYEVYLEDVDWEPETRKHKAQRLSHREFMGLRSLVLNLECDWDAVFDLFQHRNISVNDLLMGEDFLKVVQELYDRNYPEIVFSDFLWTMRSIYLPLFLVLKSQVPAADIYHCVATGYSGVLGAMAQHIHGGGLIVSEHGIYTREREEELIKATWVQSTYKSIWIEQFRRMSQLAYDRADVVTSLYDHARELQLELGAPEEKLQVTPNGINVHRLADIPGKLPEDEGWINAGAVIRVAPIKDVKTMLQAFAEAKRREPRLKLWVMGPTEEESEYAQECFQLVEMLNIPDVVFTGRVDIRDYLGRMDFMLLTSISEGQPLTILEGFAAKKPVIATDVGNCRGLIYGEEGDTFGEAGILTHIMNVEEIAAAIVELARFPEKTRAMGEAGYQRVWSKYKTEDMQAVYREIYRRVANLHGIRWTEGEIVDLLPEEQPAERG